MRGGSSPSHEELVGIDALSDARSVAAYLRKRAASGDFPLFAFWTMPDFKNSSITMTSSTTRRP